MPWLSLKMWLRSWGQVSHGTEREWMMVAHCSTAPFKGLPVVGFQILKATHSAIECSDRAHRDIRIKMVTTQDTAIPLEGWKKRFDQKRYDEYKPHDAFLSEPMTQGVIGNTTGLDTKSHGLFST